ncbi:putative MHC class I antigen protein [Naja naja]|nr:putative MHC class I antigen protein [Naja naja]
MDTNRGTSIGYDGEDFISLDQKTLTWTAVDIRAQVIKRRWEAQPFIAQNRNIFLEKECIELLQKCMVYGKDYLLRKVSRRIQYNGMETLVCRVYGFYPKEMDATWRKDGEVWEQDTFRGAFVDSSLFLGLISGIVATFFIAVGVLVYITPARILKFFK